MMSEPQHPWPITFKSVGVIFGFLIAVLTNVLTNYYDEPDIFWPGLIFAVCLVLSFDYAGEYANYGASYDEWQSRTSTTRFKVYYRPFVTGLRSWLSVLNSQIQRSAEDELHYVIYLLSDRSGNKVWLPIANYRDHHKMQFGFPYKDLWFLQAYIQNRMLVTMVSPEMLNRFNNAEQRQAFLHTQVVMAIPIHKNDDDEIIGMIAIYTPKLEMALYLAQSSIRPKIKDISRYVGTALPPIDISEETRL